VPVSSGRGALRRWWVVGLVVAATLAAAVPASAHIYWTSQAADTIGRARLDGTVAIRDFIHTAAPARGVAIDGQHVYWAQGSGKGSIGRAGLNASGTQQNFISTGKNTRGVALDSFGIYWSHLVSGAGAIGHSSLDGSNVNPLFIGTSGPPCGVAVDPDKIWWANSTDPGTVGRAHGPLDVEPRFITAGGSPCGVAATSTHVYWANRGGNSIGRASRDGTHVRQNFIRAPGACGVAVNDSRIYWTSTASNSIGTARRDGTGVNQNLIKNVSSPCGIAVDPTATAMPRSYKYPPTKVGGSGQIHAFFVQNTSSSVLDVRRVRIVGTAAADFKKTGDGCTPVNTAAGGGCILNVRFSPRGPGDRQATIKVISNASNSPTAITLTGFGISP
jgi:hypothetical protein